MSARLTVLVVACAVACAAAADARAAGWLPPEDVAGAAGTYVTPRIAIDDRNGLFAVWIRSAGAGSASVQVSRRPAGGVWEPPQTLDAEVTAARSNPDIAVDANGNAVVVWTQGAPGGPQKIRQARRLAGDARFGDESDVPPGASGNGNDFPRVVANGAGDAVVAWKGQDMLGNEEVKAIAGSVTAPFGGSPELYPETSAAPSAPDVAINERGDSGIAWQVLAGGSATTIKAAYRPAGGKFSAAEILESSPSDTLSEPRIALDAQGNALTIYTAAAGDRVRGRFKPAADPSWHVLPNLENDVSGTSFPALAFDDAGTALAAWTELTQVRVASRPGGDPENAFNSPPPQQLTGNQELPLNLTIDGSEKQGTVALAWERNHTGAIRAAIRPPGGLFGAPATLTAAGRMGFEPDIATDANGNAAAVWTDSDPAENDIRVASAVYDATAPKIGAVDVPPTGDTAAPIAMSATADDDWSTPAVVWDFGDGSAPGAGPAVTHTYTTAGTYHVTVTATDSAGNVASAARDVVVSDLPTRGVDFNASTVSGRVLVSLPANAPAGRVLARPAVAHGAAAIQPPPGYLPFRRLGENDNIPVGAILDASRGVTALTMDVDKAGKVQRGRFRAGVFKTKQRKGGALTTLTTLGGGNFKKGCKRGRIRKSGVSEARRRPRRRLFSSARGRFRTRGRHSSATVRGTKWSMTDTCKGTRTAVSSGKVAVRDFVKKRTVLVRRGHHYLARPRKARRHRR